MDISISLPFEIGDTVYVAHHVQRHAEYTCPHCLGERTLTNGNGEAVGCRNCCGYGSKGMTIEDWYPVEREVLSVDVAIDSSGTCIENVQLGNQEEDDYDYEWDVRKIFIDPIDCVTYCDAMNAKEYAEKHRRTER